MSETKASPTAEQILEAGRKRRIKEVSYLGGTVYAWGFKRTEAKAFWEESRKATEDGGDDLYQDERMVMHCIRDAAGKRIFAEQHLTQLADLNQADFGPLIVACYEVNGFGEIGRAALAKNSETTRNSSSGSDSQPGTGSA
jgi:hypothetical protein